VGRYNDVMFLSIVVCLVLISIKNQTHNEPFNRIGEESLGSSAMQKLFGLIVLI
jgi:hypothetical protein